MTALRQMLKGLAAAWGIEPTRAPLNDWNLCPNFHPMEAVDAHGGRIVGKNGREYVDLLSAWGANLLGYGNPRVAEAIRDQAGRFCGVGMPYPDFWELARRLCELIPCAESVRYGKNGSDATLGAVRLARAATGREHVLHRGYHGFHDWWQASIDCPGVPLALRERITTLGELTVDSVAAAFNSRRGGIACLVIDPMVPPIPSPEEIAEIVELAHREGALVIFDEIVSGFRLAPGGMQEIWRVRPDLACFGKAMANGMPLSALVGRDELMRRLPEVHYGMTFEGEAISIAAARATIEEVACKDVCGELARKGRRLKEGYARLAEKAGVETEIVGPDARPMFYFPDQRGVAGRELRWLCLQELARSGVLSVGTLNLCLAHGDEDLPAMENGFEAVMEALGKAVKKGSVEGLLDKRVLQALR